MKRAAKRSSEVANENEVRDKLLHEAKNVLETISNEGMTYSSEQDVDRLLGRIKNLIG